VNWPLFLTSPYALHWCQARVPLRYPSPSFIFTSCLNFFHVDLLNPFVCINFLLFESSFSCFSLWMRPSIDKRFTVFREQFQLKFFHWKDCTIIHWIHCAFLPFLPWKSFFGLMSRFPFEHLIFLVRNQKKIFYFILFNHWNLELMILSSFFAAI
jgi:hypothetical protein